MHRTRPLALALLAWPLVLGTARAASAEEPAPPPPNPAYDEALAAEVGADEYGMKRYVLVILKTGPTPVPKGPERDAMFRGHFANMKRLVEEGKLVLAGPLDGENGWRGLFIFDVDEIAEAEALVATDPVVQNGEMVAELHGYYGSAALRFVEQMHDKVAKKSF